MLKLTLSFLTTCEHGNYFKSNFSYTRMQQSVHMWSHLWCDNILILRRNVFCKLWNQHVLLAHVSNQPDMSLECFWYFENEEVKMWEKSRQGQILLRYLRLVQSYLRSSLQNFILYVFFSFLLQGFLLFFFFCFDQHH